MFPSTIASAVLGIASALSWGAADFSGGLASRRANSGVLVIVVNAVGIPLAVVIALIIGQPFPPITAILWGAAAGAAGALALVAFYRALADGAMGTLAPVAGVVGAVIPVVFAGVTQGLPPAHQIGGFGLALAGVWFVSGAGGVFGISKPLGLALLAGVGFGMFFILIRQANTPSVLWVLVASKTSSAVTTLIPTLISRQSWQMPRQSWWLSLVAGVMDMGGNAFFLFAAEAGRLDIAVVLSSLYPASTVLLAGVVLKERVSRTQAWGVAAMLAALPLIVL